MKFLVTGCGRSGTAYFNKLLNNLGIKSAHERIFDPKNKDWDGVSLPKWDDDISEVAWEAAFFLGKLPKMNLIHIVRHPIKQMNSLKRLNFFENEDIWCQYFLYYKKSVKSYPAIKQYMSYYFYVNHSVLYWKPHHDYYLLNIENVCVPTIKELFQHYGLNFTDKQLKKAIESIPKDFNTAGDKSKDSITYDSLPDCELYHNLNQISIELGYNIREVI